MYATRIGGYKKSGPYVEVTVRKTASYADVAEAGIQQLHTEFPVSSDEEHDLCNGPLTLFRPDGTVIPSGSLLTELGETTRWSLGLYMTQLKKSPSQLKLGVGYLSLVCCF